jgi:transposase-like protein
MKHSNGSPRPRRNSTGRKRREELLAAFDRSGLSAAAFARRHGLHYTTLCGWRQRRSKASPGFVQVELPPASVPVELVIEVGPHARMRITSVDQVDLVVRLLQALNTPTAC